jgi:hypothetical protein
MADPSASSQASARGIRSLTPSSHHRLKTGCRRGAACPLDLWPRYLAPAAVGTLTKGSLKSFLHLTGADTGRGVLHTWLGQDRRGPE